MIRFRFSTIYGFTSRNQTKCNNEYLTKNIFQRIERYHQHKRARIFLWVLKMVINITYYSSQLYKTLLCGRKYRSVLSCSGSSDFRVLKEEVVLISRGNYSFRVRNNLFINISMTKKTGCDI